MTKLNKPNYGVDAPPVIRNLFLIGIICLLSGYGAYQFLNEVGKIISIFLFIGAIYCMIAGLWMLWSSYIGKVKLREQLLNELHLQGNEKVLDLGCGRGLLLIGAAMRLGRGGKAFGLDLWREGDLSGNSYEQTLANAKCVGLIERVEVVSGDMQDMSFENAYFDTVVSSMAIHNLSTAEARKKALQEVVRVLKPGGKIALWDFQFTKEYHSVLKGLGCVNLHLSRSYFRVFPPVRILHAEKRPL